MRVRERLSIEDAIEETSSIAAKKRGACFSDSRCNIARRQIWHLHIVLNTSATAQWMKKDKDDKKVRLPLHYD